MSVFYGFCKVK